MKPAKPLPPAPRFDGKTPGSANATTSMRANRARGTKPEVMLAKALWTAGLRYRKNVKKLPGTPDLVFGPQRVVIFVDGDFWHGRDWEALRPRLARGNNPDYWVPKIARNRAKDVQNNAALTALGWTVLRFWESDIRKDLDAVVARILVVLDRL